MLTGLSFCDETTWGQNAGEPSLVHSPKVAGMVMGVGWGLWVRWSGRGCLKRGLLS